MRGRAIAIVVAMAMVVATTMTVKAKSRLKSGCAGSRGSATVTKPMMEVVAESSSSGLALAGLEIAGVGYCSSEDWERGASKSLTIRRASKPVGNCHAV